MTLDLIGKVYCLAGIGGRVAGIMETTKATARGLVIDGCRQESARKAMELAGSKKFQYLKIADIVFEKGKTRVTTARIRQVVASRLIV